MALKIFVIALIGIQAALASESKNQCESNYIGWNREETKFVFSNGKRERVPKSDTVMYHATLIQIDSDCQVHVENLPAFIDEVKKDTAYSASDGGFWWGNGVADLAGEMVKVNGKYTGADYSKIGRDSTFKFGLVKMKSAMVDQYSKRKFRKVTKNEAKDILEKWGMSQK